MAIKQLAAVFPVAAGTVAGIFKAFSDVCIVTMLRYWDAFFKTND